MRLSLNKGGVLANRLVVLAANVRKGSGAAEASRSATAACRHTQDLEPAGQVARVSKLAVDAAVGEQICRTHVGDQLLGCIGGIAKALSQLPVTARRM